MRCYCPLRPPFLRLLPCELLVSHNKQNYPLLRDSSYVISPGMRVYSDHSAPAALWLFPWLLPLPLYVVHSHFLLTWVTAQEMLGHSLCLAMFAVLVVSHMNRTIMNLFCGLKKTKVAFTLSTHPTHICPCLCRKKN